MYIAPIQRWWLFRNATLALRTYYSPVRKWKRESRDLNGRRQRPKLFDKGRKSDAVRSMKEKGNKSVNLQLGTLTCTAVGLRYDEFLIRPGEPVTLIREPTHAKDSNAIRVYMGKKPIEYIDAKTSPLLSKVMDKFPTTLSIDGKIALQGATLYSVPLNLTLYTHHNSASDVVHMIKILKELPGWKLHEMMIIMLTSTSGSTTRGSKRIPMNFDNIDDVTNQVVRWEDTHKKLDAIFDQLADDQLKNLPPIPIPSTLITPLLDHQLDGIRWLHKNEMNIDSRLQQKHQKSSKTAAMSTPFYQQIQKGSETLWLSEITQKTQKDPPEPIRGSLLADDMGLGKSLQALGLILTNGPKSTNEPKTTLIVCPVSVMLNWVKQVEQHVLPNTLKVGVYHGPQRFNLLSKLSELDILVTSYDIISKEFSSYSPNVPADESHGNKENESPYVKPESSIFEKYFHRIILDEAHTIRNEKAKVHSACMALQARYRLCVTGTPLYNKPEDIHSFLKFLSFEPFVDRSVFVRAIARPTRDGDPKGLSRLRTVMTHVALRRSKSKVLNLPPKTVILQSVTFPESCLHKEIYDILFASTQNKIRTTLLSGNDIVISKPFMQVLERIMRVRQACVSGLLVPKRIIQAAKDTMNGDLSAQDDDTSISACKATTTTECAKCFEVMDVDDVVVLRTCSHAFCELCLRDVSECPVCQCNFEESDFSKSCVVKELSMMKTMDSLGPSPKLKALALAITEMKEDEKGVIFSQFTGVLDILEQFFNYLGRTHTRFDGKTTILQRNTAIREFSAEVGGPRFLLCSHAAGTGITLTRANHCFIMDPWWNSSAEQQAMDRIHRIGQKRDVRIIRFIMKDTIEEKMIVLQEAKAAIGKGSMEKLTREEARKANLTDSKHLFSVEDE